MKEKSPTPPFTKGGLGGILFSRLSICILSRRRYNKNMEIEAL
jgi:hypothetical protein